MTKLTFENAEGIMGRKALRDMLPVGTELRTLVRSVASSGMSRRISVFLVRGNELINLDTQIERAGIAKSRGHKQGLYIGGAGMDMCFKLTYDIGQTLHGDGYALKNRNI